MITIEELKKNIEDLGYIATEELLYDTYNALCIFSSGEINPGQDIFAICLEGPPGAGKTEFAKTYTKVCNKVFGVNVEMVDYQCDATTGKTELFEDINISAAIRGDADHVNIPGKLIEAINKVNKGKRVILFIDEYDKAREETDAFLLQFLQSGKINSTQHGDLEIRDEYKGNLQVILCKNDMREELSGPLSRRIRIIRLDYMEPNTFYQIAYRTLVENRKDKVNDGLLNLVALMYQHAYASKEVYNRIPSCSEMLIAIEDADRLLKRANAPQYVIYNTIIRNMFKSSDDIKTFENSLDRLKNEDDSKLSALIKGMKVTESNEPTVDLNTLIAEKVFVNESTKLSSKVEELQKIIDEYTQKFKDMETARQATIDKEVEKILLQNGQLVLSDERIEAVPNFGDESAYVKRGASVYGYEYTNWTEIARLKLPHLSHEELINKTITYASNLDVQIYEDGVMVFDRDSEQVIVVKDLNGDYVFMSNLPLISSTTLNDVYSFIRFATQVLINQYSKNQLSEYGSYSISTLIYNDDELPLSKTSDNVYAFDFEEQIDPNHINLIDKISTFKCATHDKVVLASKEILGSKRKVLINEEC